MVESVRPKMRDPMRFYGAQLEVYSFLPFMEILTMQALNKWHYEFGIPRCQVSFGTQKYFYFTQKVAESYEHNASSTNIFMLDFASGEFHRQAYPSLNLINTVAVQIKNHLVVVDDKLVIKRYGCMDGSQSDLTCEVLSEEGGYFESSLMTSISLFALAVYKREHLYITGGRYGLKG